MKTTRRSFLGMLAAIPFAATLRAGPALGALPVTVKANPARSLREAKGMFHVADYGAVGDGDADDSTAIQAAIDAANEYQVRTGNFVVVFLMGAHLISKTVRLSGTKMRLQGMPSFTEIIRPTDGCAICT